MHCPVADNWLIIMQYERKQLVNILNHQVETHASRHMSHTTQPAMGMDIIGKF